MSKEAGRAGNARYDDVYRHSVADPEDFWGRIARELHWYQKWDRVLDDSNPPFFRWFVGGRTNLCYNAVDRHVLGGLAEKTALAWESTAQGKSETITYGELYRRVNHFAGVLKSLGVEKGDRVAIYLPMIPETAVAMLACARIGAIHVVVFTGYGVNALAKRVSDSEPKVLITADAGLRRNRTVLLKDTVDKALEKAPVARVIVLNRGLAEVDMIEGRDYYWDELVDDKGDEYVESVPMESNEPSYILYTAGTTGKIYGVVRDTGGYMVAMYNSMRQIYDVGADEVFWAASDLGWVVGHSYTVYAPLLFGVTSVIYEGTPDYPDHGVMWRVIEKYRVNAMFAAPTTMRMLQRFGIDHVKKCDISSLHYLFLGGEILDIPTWQWCMEALDGGLVIDHYWLTESSWPVLSNLPGIELLPIKLGSVTKPVVGYKMAIVDDAGRPVPANTAGYLVAEPPLPPGNIVTLWGDDERYRREYWQQIPGMFATGDYAVADDDGYVRLLGRTDEVMNVAAHRLSMREIEMVLESHPAVAEACIIGVADAVKGEEPIALIILEPGREPSSQLRVGIKNLVRESIGAIATPRGIHFVSFLPRTRDGRYMKKVLRAAYEKQDLSTLSITEDGASAEEVREAFREAQKMLETVTD
ncbi:MAG TPA: propionyl-CoA synthetase [Dehalococcoidia bacterium]|nr:propionyl-CoA synthetase [Dehalococcoidia bacterium]